MTVKELIEELQKYDPDAEAVIYENERGRTFSVDDVGENSYGKIVLSTDGYF
jgi:hypothetical protein